MCSSSYILIPLSSRDWVCPTCKVSNLEGLPDPAKDASLATVAHPEEPSVNPLPERLQQGMPEKTFKVLDAATVTTITDPPVPIHPPINMTTPPILAPKPMRPIDAASIIIPASPSRPSTPLSPIPASAPTHMQPQLVTTIHHGLPVQQEQQQDSRAHTPVPSPSVARRHHPRPPILLDTAICVLLVSVFALICRRIL